MNDEQNQKKDVKKKHTLRNCIIAILVLIVVCFGACAILYVNNLLPDNLQEQINKILGKNEEDKTKENEDKKEEPAEIEETEDYEVIAELNKKYNDAEILDLANYRTMVFGTFSEDVMNKYSIMILDDTYGLVSNEDGSVLIEPKYTYLTADMPEDDGEYLYGYSDDATHKIDLETMEIDENPVIIGHGGGSLEFYDPTEKVIWSQEYEDIVEFTPDTQTTKRYKNIGTELAIAFEMQKNTTMEESEELRICYYNVKTGKIVIEPEYTKGTLFFDGIAAVQKNGKTTFINEENKKVYDLEFEDATSIHDGKAWVKEEGVWKLVEINEDNKLDTVEDEEISDDWKQIYRDFIADGNIKDYEVITAGSRASTISFIDLDSDGVPELMHYDGMEPGPTGNISYEVYSINNGNVEDVGQVWSGPFVKVGYNKKTKSYGFDTESYGISATQGAITIYTEDGLEDRTFNIGEDVSDLESEGYEVNSFEITEYRFDNELTDEAKEENLEKAMEDYVLAADVIK